MTKPTMGSGSITVGIRSNPHQCVHICKSPPLSTYVRLVPRLHSPAFLAPRRKAGTEPGIFRHVLRDVGCVVWCVDLLIELHVTFSVVRQCIK